MTDRERRAIEKLLEVAGDLGWAPPAGGDWIDAYRDGEAITTDIAAHLAGCSPQTVRRRAAEAAAAGQPIGVLVAQSAWLISLRRWLDDIERHEGLPGLVAAKARLAAQKKCKPERVAPKIDINVRAATG